MSGVKVSILINNYNYSTFLPAAIDSALSQTYNNIEVIVVDDGSTDDSRTVINKYANKLLPVFQENGGQASAINAGFRRSTGDIVIFLDSDDMLKPDIVEQVVSCFETNPRLVKVQFRLQVVDAHGQPTGGLLPPLHISLPSGDLTTQLAHTRSYPHPPTSGNAFRRSACARLMPIPEDVYRKGAPAYLMYTVGIFGVIQSIETVGGLYRIHTSNITGKNPYLDGNTLASHLEEEVCTRRKQIELFQSIHGRNLPEIGRRDFTNIKTRVIIKKLYPDKYKYNHSLAELALRGLVSTCSYPNMKRIDRPVWFFWFITMLVVPRIVAYKLVTRATDHRSRGRLFESILGARDRRH